MAGSVLLVTWAVRLRRLARSVPEQRPPVEQRAAEAALVFALVSLLMFWGAADHAQAVGQSLAASLEQRVATLPHAELYSVKPLGIGGPAVKEVRFGSAASPLYRYDGLRLLEVSGGRFFFQHDGWTVRNGVGWCCRTTTRCGSNSAAEAAGIRVCFPPDTGSGGGGRRGKTGRFGLCGVEFHAAKSEPGRSIRLTPLSLDDGPDFEEALAGIRDAPGPRHNRRQ